MRKYVILLFFIFSVFTAQSQSLDFRHYQVEDGLSNNTVIDILQDNSGFLWFGTSDGLNRFDGYSFKVFRKIDNDKTTLGSNAITYLYQDKKNVLWVGTSKGIYYYDSARENFTQLPGTENKTIRFIHENNGNILFSQNEVYIYNSVKKHTRIINAEDKNPSSIISTPNNDVWIGTEDGFLGKYIAHENSFLFFCSFWQISEITDPY